MADLRAFEVREADSFDIPSVKKFCLKLSTPGVASFLFPLKDLVLLKTTGFVFIVLVTEGTRIVFVMLELLESMLPNLSKLYLIHGLLERKWEKHILL